MTNEVVDDCSADSCGFHTKQQAFTPQNVPCGCVFAAALHKIPFYCIPPVWGNPRMLRIECGKGYTYKCEKKKYQWGFQVELTAAALAKKGQG